MKSIQGVSCVSFIVYGQVFSMKNDRRLLKNPRNGKIFSAKGENAERYVADFCAQVPAQYRGIKLGSAETPLRATVTVVYPSHRQDLDCELIFDCLQIAEVIENDRWIIEKHLYASVDPKNPHCQIQIEEI